MTNLSNFLYYNSCVDLINSKVIKKHWIVSTMNNKKALYFLLVMTLSVSLSSHSESVCNLGYLEMDGDIYPILDKYECYDNFIREQKNKNPQKCETSDNAIKNSIKLEKKFPDSTIYLVGETMYVVEIKDVKYSLFNVHMAGSPAQIIDISKFNKSFIGGSIAIPTIDKKEFINEEKPLFDFRKNNIEDNYWGAFGVPKEKRFKGKVFNYKSCPKETPPTLRQNPELLLYDNKG